SAPVAVGFLPRGVGHAGLGGIGQFDVTDRTLDLLDVGGHAFVALAAHAGRPAHRGAFTDLGLPLRADLGQVVDPVEGRAGTVGAVHDVDLAVGQGDAGIECDDRRVVPAGNVAQVDG